MARYGLNTACTHANAISLGKGLHNLAFRKVPYTFVEHPSSAFRKVLGIFIGQAQNTNNI